MHMGENMADVKRKHKGSKKSKRSWRLHTDVADVEEHLDDERRDERTGGAVSKKGNDALFFVDKAVEGDNIASKGQTKKRTKSKTTKQDDDDDDDEEVYVSNKEKMMKKLAEKNKAEQKKAAQKANVKVESIWGQEVMKVENDYLEPTVKRPKVKPLTVGVGKSNIDAVTLPKPGASYNPDYDSHQELLSEAHQEELKKMVAHQKLNEKVKMISVAEMKKRSKEWLKEMSVGLFDTGDDNQVERSDSENEEDAPQLHNSVPKTLKQRRKEKLKRELEQQMKDEKVERIKHHDVYRIKRLKKEIRKEDAISSQRLKRKMEKANPDKTKRLGKHKYNEGEISVQLSEDLSGSLRELKPEGSLIEDRFKSLQKRNMIETRKQVIPKRKYKRKIYERRSRNTKTIKEFKLTPRRSLSGV